MTVLVTASSKHGSTVEIALAIAEVLADSGVAAEVLAPEDVAAPETFSAFVVGSAVYMGRWQEPARKFLDDNHALLGTRPVWLFSSGPIGDNESVGLDERVYKELVSTCDPRDHRLFSGKLDRSDLGRGERLISRVVRAPEGDYRDWDEIRAWARDIAAQLSEGEEAAP